MGLIFGCATAGRAAEIRTVLPEKLAFPGLVAFVHGREVTSLNFQFTVNRSGFIHGAVVKVFSRNEGKATTVLTGEERVCNLSGRLVGDFRHRPGQLRSWVQLRGSKGGVISGRLHMGRLRLTFDAQTSTPGLFGLEAERTKIEGLVLVRAVTFPTPAPWPTFTPAGSSPL